jgi:hypothetical protein
MPEPSSPVTKILVLSLLCMGIVGLLALYYLFDPAHSGFLPCPFKHLTGYNCPGCGSQRAIHQLLHGDFIAAFSFNPMLILSLPIIGYGLGVKLWNYIFKAQQRVAFFYKPKFIYGYFGIVLLYWLVRNLSIYPLL